MLNILTIIKRTALTGTAALLLCTAPSGVVLADAGSCNPPDQSSSNGVHWPTGADAGAFTYQCSGQYAGKWLSAHYVFDPSDSSVTPLDPVIYKYNASTDMYDAQVWDYNTAQSAYQQDTISVKNPPAGAQTDGTRPAPVTPSAPTANSQTAASGTGSDTADASTSSNTPAGSTSSSGSGARAGNNGVSLNGTNNVNIGNDTTVNAQTGIMSFAGSGNTTVSNNTSGGNATSGNAQSVANVINMLQSSSNVLNDPNLVTFTANINGDVNGDLLLDPANLGAVQPANVTTSLDNNVKVNNSLNANMTNDVNVGAQSGNATVADNTQGGNATSGNAKAVADIVNTLNSYVSAGKSFIGVININGNLNGDILLPPNFVDTLLAANVPHYDVTTNVSNNATVASVNNATINNNINSNATTGAATVADNTQGGTATSGNAKTNVTVFNLTGQDIVASNDILVFVNVLGSWYGMILNAPAGSTAAELGGGVTSNTNVNNNATLTNTSNQNITNNVRVGARSGDATVADNTVGGNARSGDAETATNIANMINDRLALNGWFGLLFINVFGHWIGNFGLNSPAGDPVATPQSSGNGASAPMFNFAPADTAAASGGRGAAGNYGGTWAGNSPSDGNGQPNNAQAPQNAAGSASGVLAAATRKATSDLPQLAHSGPANFTIPVAGGLLALLILLAGERKRLFRH